MNTKLTLTLDENIKEQAKKLAKKKGDSLSHIIENFLKLFISKNNLNEVEDDELSPRMKAMVKSLKPAKFKDFDIKEEKMKRLEEKYLN